jgi:hypothetical protein
MTGNLTQAVAIPSLMGGSAYKGSVRYNNKGGLHTINSLLAASENHRSQAFAFCEPSPIFPQGMPSR